MIPFSNDDLFITRERLEQEAGTVEGEGNWAVINLGDPVILKLFRTREQAEDIAEDIAEEVIDLAGEEVARLRFMLFCAVSQPQGDTGIAFELLWESAHEYAAKYEVESKFVDVAIQIETNRAKRSGGPVAWDRVRRAIDDEYETRDSSDDSWVES